MKMILTVLKIVGVVYLCLCVLLYFMQEKIIFLPEKLAADYTFYFTQPFEELTFTTTDQTQLNGLLFKAVHSKGLIFYLHGNAGSLRSWGEIAKVYTQLGYDLFLPDYRGYGKSGGHIQNETQLHTDIQLLYDSIRQRYDEKNIIVLGYSIGTGMATKLASNNHPKLLILQAPYYNLTDLVKHILPVIPAFMLKYTFSTNDFIKHCSMPVVIFHGDKDEVIYYGSSLKLKLLLKSTDTLITLHGQGHNGMSDNPVYRNELQRILDIHFN